MLDHDDKDFIILDDIPWERFPAYKAILGCQREFTLTDKYHRKVALRNWNLPCLVLWNEDMYPEEWCSNKNLIDWLAENVEIVRLNKKLY